MDFLHLGAARQDKHTHVYVTQMLSIIWLIALVLILICVSGHLTNVQYGVMLKCFVGQPRRLASYWLHRQRVRGIFPFDF